MPAIQIGKHSSINYMLVKVTTPDPQLPEQWIETWTGWAQVHQVGGGQLTHVTVDLFLPTAENQIKMHLAPFNESNPAPTLNATVMVAPTAWDATEDEASLVAVDNAGLVWLEKTFPGIQGQQKFLVLRVDCGILNAKLLRIAYQVNVHSKPHSADFAEIDPTDAPW